MRLDTLLKTINDTTQKYKLVIGRHLPVGPIPAQHEFLESRHSVAETLKKYGIADGPPLPSVTCREIIDYAIMRDIAFEDDGKNLQHSVIVLTAVEHILTHSRKTEERRSNHSGPQNDFVGSSVGIARHSRA